MLPGICDKFVFSTTSISGAWLVVVLSLLSRVTEIVVAFGFNAKPKLLAGAFNQAANRVVTSTNTYLLAVFIHCSPDGHAPPAVTSVMEGFVLYVTVPSAQVEVIWYTSKVPCPVTAEVYSFSVALLIWEPVTAKVVSWEMSNLIRVVPLDDCCTTRDGLFPLLVVGCAEET